MKAIETTVFVDEKGQFTLQLPQGVVLGHHRVVMVIDEQVNEEKYKDSGDGGSTVTESVSGGLVSDSVRKSAIAITYGSNPNESLLTA